MSDAHGLVDTSPAGFLHIDGIEAAYRRQPVLSGVTLPPLGAGEITCIVGPNAAGKSTLLRCVAGLHPRQGRVELRGTSATGASARHRMLYVPQDPPPPSAVSVFGAVELALRVVGRGGGSAGEVAGVLARLELDGLATRRMSELSGGQRQMVGLAQAVIRRPAVLLLDEPTSNLDLRNQLEILDVIAAIATEVPATVLMVVHDLGLAARVADRIAVLHDGRVHSCGCPHEVLTPALLEEVYRVHGGVPHHPRRPVDRDRQWPYLSRPVVQASSRAVQRQRPSRPSRRSARIRER